MPTAQDMAFVWECRNDAVTRARSINGDLIDYETHRVWWMRFLANSDARLWIAIDGEDRIAIGYGRATWEHDVAEISVALHLEARGRGFGTQLIRATTAAIFKHRPTRYVTALILPNNVPSLRAFHRAGDACTGTVENSSQHSEMHVYD